MSRIGKKPVQLPKNVSVKVENDKIIVEGPKGKLEQSFDSGLIDVKIETGQVVITRKSETKRGRELHGLIRMLLSNMIEGVDKGITRKLEIVGVGYRAMMEGKNLKLQLGYSHPVIMEPPAGIEYKVESNNIVFVSGIDKEAVGQAAVEIRKKREPEPYKGKGVRYAEEKIVIKPGKTGKSA